MSPTATKGAGCDREALHAHAVGLLAPEKQQPLLDHLQTCAACREDLRWLERVDRLLGFTPDGHPSSAAIVDYALGRLDAGRRAELAAHFSSCVSCNELVEGARGGHAHIEHLERSEEAVATRSIWEGQLSTLQLSIVVPGPPVAVAAAADGDRTPAPVPEDRRVVVEEPDVFRVVYWREGGQGYLAVFTERPGEPEVLGCTLDDSSLGSTPNEEGLLYDLGPVENLFGSALSLKLRLKGVERTLHFSIVEE